MKRPRVSIIVPVKDGEADLERLLGTVADLSYPRSRLEVVVCDNGSSDGTVEVARRFGSRVLELPGETVAGLRNAGARAAVGEVLAFVDADCTVASWWVGAAVFHLVRTGVVAAGCYPFAPEGGTWVQRLWNLKERVKPEVHEAAWLPSMNLVVDREAFEAVGGFDATLGTCEDVDLCYRLRDRGGRIVWDERIRVVHHGEPPTLAVLFRKERWHGSSNLRGLVRHGLRREELTSLVLPAAVLGAWTVPFCLVPVAPWAVPPLVALPPALAVAGAVRTAGRARKLRLVAPLSAIYLVYLAARAAALVDEVRGER